jgi:hypothetical protein
MQDRTILLLLALAPGGVAVTIAAALMNVWSLKYFTFILVVGLCEWLLVMRILGSSKKGA